MKPKRISSVLYIFSLVVWGFNLFCGVFHYFINILPLWMIVVFVCVLIEGIWSGAFNGEPLIPDGAYKKCFLDYCLSISSIVAHCAAVFGFLGILIAGGTPEEIDGVFCVVNHGDIVRTVSEGWYLFLLVCELFIFTFGLLIFSSLMAMRIRKLYVMQKSEYA